MFERFTDRARRVVVLAQEQARDFGHDRVDAEHLLLGLLAEGEGVAAKALQSLDVSLARVRLKVEALRGQGTVSVGHLPLTAACKKVMELSLRQAIALNCNYIGTEHLLLGIVELPPEAAASQILAELGVLDRIRDEVIPMIVAVPPSEAEKAAAVALDALWDVLAAAPNVKVTGTGHRWLDLEIAGESFRVIAVGQERWKP